MLRVTVRRHAALDEEEVLSRAQGLDRGARPLLYVVERERGPAELRSFLLVERGGHGPIRVTYGHLCFYHRIM